MKHLKNVHEHLHNRSTVSKNLFKLFPVVLLVLAVTSCSSVKVASDYDKNVNFSKYKTFAFFKPGIDKAEINGIDKRRILHAIESELLAKGFTKSETPDFLVSIFTKSNQRVDIYNNYWGYGAWGWGGYGPWGWGGYGSWGWGGYGPWGWGGYGPIVSTSTEGVLFIDLINAEKKELIWQGQGTGYLTQNMDKKEARIKEFVSKILEKYPPGAEK